MRSMRISLGDAVIELAKGDITTQEVDAIVNAANKRLEGGGGVDGAIHEAGGPSILEELRRRFPGGCSTGNAVVTKAGELRAQFVIHSVGPSYDPNEKESFASKLGV
jgi:O-acetyl-ADP-ribose deacetylase (regulator of RNase III)